MEFKVGDKVVPHSKTFFLFDETVNDSIVWKRAGDRKQPFLYVIKVSKRSTGETYLMCDDHSDSVTGDYFMPHDVTLYVGVERKVKFKVGDKVVPHAKTVPGYGSLEQSAEWAKARDREQPFLYVTWVEKQLGDNTPCLICGSYEGQRIEGDYFLPDDVTLYEEPEVVQQEMGDVIVYSHCCSREELAELIEYLEAKCWDYRIIQKEKS